jgi:hypothetical protein
MCTLEVVTGVVGGSTLEYFCDGNSNTYDSVAEFRCQAGDHHETWNHDEIALPHRKPATLGASCKAFAIDGVVRILSGAQTTVIVKARIKAPGGVWEEHEVCSVKGTNGTVEFPRLLIVMAQQ